MDEIHTKLSRNIRLWPILYTIGCDLFFFWVINVAFLTEVKGLSYEQFFMLDLIAAAVDIVTTVPLLYLISRIGNNSSLRIASLLMLVSAVLFTFGNSFALFIIANVLYFKAYQFFIVYPIILENNLSKYGIKKDFVKYNARARAGYAGLSLLVALVAGYLFNLNAYIPMILCITLTLVAFVLSFFVCDETGGKYNATQVLARSKVKMSKDFFVFTILILVFMLIFKGGWYIANSYAKISLQEIGVIIETLSIIIFVARGVRVIIDLCAEKIISKFKHHLSYLLPILLTIGLLLLAIPLFAIHNFVIQLVLVCLGILIIYSIYDIYKLYVYDLVVSMYPHEMHLRLFWLNNVLESVGILCMNVIITCMLANFDVGYSLLAIAGATVIAFATGLYTYFKYLRKGQINTEPDPNDFL